MTPEERWTKIENALQALAESQAESAARHDRHDKEIAELRAHERKQDEGIRDLIVVSRTLVDSQLELAASHKKLVDSQKAAFDAIDRLSARIDKFLQGRGSNGHQ
ncbi:MAG: hypothetical protein HY646_19390 [Acidobacteria bacterium]|nr:hypothetical protein [Acidobacteriota bacterium]